MHGNNVFVFCLADIYCFQTKLFFFYFTLFYFSPTLIPGLVRFRFMNLALVGYRPVEVSPEHYIHVLNHILTLTLQKEKVSKYCRTYCYCNVIIIVLLHTMFFCTISTNYIQMPTSKLLCLIIVLCTSYS